MAASNSSQQPIPPAPSIPVTFSASFSRWWSAGDKQCAAAERRLLRQLPFLSPERMPSSAVDDSPVIACNERIELTAPNHYLNTLSIKATIPSPTAPPPVVLLHDFGAGLAYFYRNLPALATWAGNRGTNVYALDWLGMGRSARVPFRIRAKRSDIPGRVREAESFFIDSLEEWRSKTGLEKMTLIGHSLGAYLIVAYALRYPTRVHKLILLSPAGVPHNPDTLSMPPTLSRRLFVFLWEAGWSPFQIVRSTLCWGPMLVGKYSRRRFRDLPEDEKRNIHDYTLNVTIAKGSGEYCTSYILAPDINAHLPLVDRIPALKMPITFVYGEQDWMDPEGGRQAIRSLREAGNENGRMSVIPRAGHQVYLDNPTETNRLIIEELDRADL